MNRATIPVLATTMAVALIAPSNVAAALLQAQPAPRIAVVPPPAPGAPPAIAILPPRPGMPALAVVPPTTPGAPPTLAVIPPDPNAPPIAVTPPPGAQVRVVIPVAANAVAGLPDCSATVTSHCVLNRRNPSR